MLTHKFAATIVAGLVLCSPLFAGPQTPRRIEITASKFAYSPNEITLKKNDPVVLVLHSTDVTHGLVIPELNIAVTEIKKDKDVEVPLTPTKTGHFTGQCAHFCGTGHGTMLLQVEVTD
jgi:cytochrome c oxidase subunit 2